MQNALANLMPLFVDQNGCHCLSAALASLAAKDSQFIFDCACENALQISQGVPAGPAEFYAFLPTENNFLFFQFLFRADSPPPPAGGFRRRFCARASPGSRDLAQFPAWGPFFLLKAPCFADRFGCAILQRCLDSGSPEQQNSLAEAICVYARDLARDTQGNYIIQHVLGMTRDGAEAVIAALSGSFFELSTHKFASNVVEKCIEAPGGSAVVDELLPNVYSLFDHPSGNYVVQGMVMKGDKTQVAAIRACPRPTP